MRYPGYVQWLKSSTNGSEFPHFIFSGDTDMGMEGLVAFTNIELKKLLLTKLEPSEFFAGEAGYLACEVRINKMLGTDHYRDVRLVGVEARSAEQNSGNFKFFEAPKVVYSDIHSSEGTAIPIWRQEASDFIEAGGTIEWFTA